MAILWVRESEISSRPAVLAIVKFEITQALATTINLTALATNCTSAEILMLLWRRATIMAIGSPLLRHGDEVRSTALAITASEVIQ